MKQYGYHKDPIIIRLGEGMPLLMVGGPNQGQTKIASSDSQKFFFVATYEKVAYGEAANDGSTTAKAWKSRYQLEKLYRDFGSDYNKKIYWVMVWLHESVPPGAEFDLMCSMQKEGLISPSHHIAEFLKMDL